MKLVQWPASIDFRQLDMDPFMAMMGRLQTRYETQMRHTVLAMRWSRADSWLRRWALEILIIMLFSGKDVLCSFGCSSS